MSKLNVCTADSARLICMLMQAIQEGKPLGECLRDLYAKACGGGKPGEDAIRESQFLDILDAAGVFAPEMLEAAFYDHLETRNHAQEDHEA